MKKYVFLTLFVFLWFPVASMAKHPSLVVVETFDAAMLSLDIGSLQSTLQPDALIQFNNCGKPREQITVKEFLNHLSLLSNEKMSYERTRRIDYSKVTKDGLVVIDSTVTEHMVIPRVGLDDGGLSSEKVSLIKTAQGYKIIEMISRMVCE